MCPPLLEHSSIFVEMNSEEEPHQIRELKLKSFDNIGIVGKIKELIVPRGVQKLGGFNVPLYPPMKMRQKKQRHRSKLRKTAKNGSINFDKRSKQNKK
jgi:hypothetical protein